MNKNKALINSVVVSLLIILSIVASGCTSTEGPVDSANVIVSAGPLIIKEFQEQDLAVQILNNATAPIDSITATSFGTFVLGTHSGINIPGKTNEPVSASLTAKVQAPSFVSAPDTTMLTISYASGMDEKGNPVISSKEIPVETIVLPNAKLQFTGFTKGMEKLRNVASDAMELNKGDNATITFSVKNEGQSTIEEETLTVRIEVENKRIGTNNSLVISEAMAKSGTSYTKGLQLPILDDAPNGETDVFVTLLMGDHVLDSKTLVLKVNL